VRIISIRLENIKSYRDMSIDFAPGTIAIRGKNGAGKSTLVEAIGFALFDTLPYKQTLFVREGERTGTVTVTFASALDQREYQAVRRCGGAAEWFIYDPDLADRVVEQKADVTAFLRQHLRIESDLSLGALFTDAVGVPQGTFTADFLLTPANRKTKFDTLLQVEDYRNAASKLHDTKNYIEQQQRDQDHRIEALERETAQLDGWREQLGASHAQERALTQRLAALQRESESLETERKALLEQQQQMTRLEHAAALAQTELYAAEARRQQTESQLREAVEAVRVCTESRSDHDEFIASEKRLAKTRAREQQRAAAREQRAEAARELEGASRELTHAQQQLAAAEEAARELARLEPLAARQQTLDDERASAHQRVARRDEVAATHQHAERDYDAARQSCEQDELELVRLEQLRPEADALGGRRRQLEAAQAAHATHQTNSDRLEAVRTELREHQEQRDEEAQIEEKAATNLRKILAQQAVVEGFPALETAQKQVADQILQVRTRIEQHRLAREQSGMGACPFLREPCLNIQRRGENSLITYFDRLIASDEAELAPLLEQAESLAAEMEHARTVLSFWDRRGMYEDQQGKAAKKRQRHEAESQRLTAEQQRLEDALATARDDYALARLRADCDRSEKAALECARLPEIQRRLDETRTRRDTLATEIERLARELAKLDTAADDLRRVAARLAELGDPRSQVTTLRPIASDISRRDMQRKRAEAELQRTDARLAACDQRLAPFAGLDEELARLEDAHNRTREGHQRYLRHEQLAAQQGERKQAHAVAEQETRAATSRSTRVAREFEQARTRFDGERLAVVNARYDALRGEHGQCTEALRGAQKESERLTHEITRVEALLADLSAAREERRTLDYLARKLRHFRDTIKEAGPKILRLQLHTISGEANRIFGEIMGDRSAQLAWEDDYEIVLRRDGRERTFAQLSGGEQMSAALAVRLALLRHLSRLGMALFDEPTQNMDDVRRVNLAEQIRRVHGFDQLIVISHDDTFEQGLDGVIHLEKLDGQTVVLRDDTLIPA
jgi:exonuclease SbcC